jgi:hypothetical protein
VLLTATPSRAAQAEGAEPLECWCCGAAFPDADLIRLGNHREVGVCLRCAHFLHQQALARQDARRPSPATRVRDVLRAARRTVMQRGWHQRPIIGRPLRWLGRRLP